MYVACHMIPLKRTVDRRMTWIFWKVFADIVTDFIFLLTMKLEGSF